ncbi:MAG: hypothetical protein O6939_06120 [Bacteroidetes bacterium]|nr:hypothetical protein [Bacteroidota bacterium]
MKIIKVQDSHTRKEFLLLPVRLYKNEPHYIRPLDKDIEAVFDLKKNRFFRHGECIRWILENDSGVTIGRVAAFIDQKTAKKGDFPVGGLGFFECINDQEMATVLFDTCKQWLEGKGMEAMDGPINFGERDKWWGLLVEGFDIDPNYCTPYNFPHYRKLFEDNGFKTYFEQYTYARKALDQLSPMLQEKADRIARNPGYTFRHMELKKIEKYTEDFRTVYNKAWAGHGTPELSSLQAKNIMKQMKPIIDERIIWFGYYREEPVCFYINLPEVNQIFKYLNGQLDLRGKLKFLYYKWRGVCRKMFGVAFGITPEHQGKGLEGALIMATNTVVVEKNRKYDDLEFNWVGDFNPRMIHVLDRVGTYNSKTHITFRKLFDENREFQRMPIIK